VSPRLTAFILMCLPLAAMAQIYQYKDAQGRMVFSDTPPPDAKATRKNINVAPPSGDSARPLEEKMQEFQKRRDAAAEQEAKQAKARAEQEKAAENCTRARNKLAALQSGQRIVRYNAQGEREFLDDSDAKGRPPKRARLFRNGASERRMTCRRAVDEGAASRCACPQLTQPAPSASPPPFFSTLPSAARCLRTSFGSAISAR
jgi:hypothetical protein